MPQTPVQTSLLQKVLQYFELAASLGMEIPIGHVAQISALIEALAQDLSNLLPAAMGQATPTPAPVVVPSPPVQVPEPTVAEVVKKEEPVTPPVTEEPPAWFKAWLATQTKA